ncbi:hypothetical protein PQQ51_33655, partial [Paraburkholderia xenovorans]|uniref:hypothetical protein n=1 Tax=Paraburkholderia xenovorans TaxID=36873 RepID=UPI0038BAE6C6
MSKINSNSGPKVTFLPQNPPSTSSSAPTRRSGSSSIGGRQVPSGPLADIKPRTGRRETTFVTKEDRYAPSAYHVDSSGKTQRARQEHKDGAAVTSVRSRTQAFVNSGHQMHALNKAVNSDMQSLAVKPDTALRMGIMDGLASPFAAANKKHVETLSDSSGLHLSRGV